MRTLARRLGRLRGDGSSSPHPPPSIEGESVTRHIVGRACEVVPSTLSSAVRMLRLRERWFLSRSHSSQTSALHIQPRCLLGIKHGVPKDSLGQWLPAGVHGSQLEILLDPW